MSMPWCTILGPTPTVDQLLIVAILVEWWYGFNDIGVGI